MITPPKPKPGDRIAIISPSSGGPASFPAVYELGLARLREWGLEPVEYPHTRAVAATPKQRADDVMVAFADPSVTAVLASIGGEDQIKVLPHLDPDVLRANPKPFFGYSDCTNLLLYLWNLGIASFHGGSVLVQLARGGRVHPVSEASLKAALFSTGPWELPQPEAFTDEDNDWDNFDPALEPSLRPSPPWSWHGRAGVVTGLLWGGNLEIIDWNLRANRWIGPNEQYAGSVLLLETSEEQPDATYVYRVLMAMGERGLLQKFAGVVVAKPKATSIDHPRLLHERAAYTAAQLQAVIRALDEYHPLVPTVFGLDAGHTDPMVVLPIGGQVTLDPGAGRVTVTY